MWKVCGLSFPFCLTFGTERCIVRFMILPAIRFHILTPFLVGKLVVLPPFRGAILPFEKNAEDFRIFFKKFFEQQNTPVRKARTGV